MCKLAIIPYIPAGKEQLAFELAQALTPYLTSHDNDGFGYMALGTNGLFGERWLNVDSAWAERTDSKLSKYSPILKGDGSEYNTFGTHTPRVFGIALHARMATCGVSMANVHPFVSLDGNAGIVHNGVITNSRDYTLKLSTCDSEAILQQYELRNVADTFDKLHDAITGLEGWYAVAAYSKDSKGNWYLDIFKESRSRLYAVWVDDLDTTVFVTDPEHLELACEELKMSHGHAVEVKPNMAMRTNAMTGEVLAYFKIKPVVSQVFTTGLAASEQTVAPYLYDDSIADVDYDRLTDDDGPVKDLVDELNDPLPVSTRRGY
jgi:hypothetical protein